MKHIADNIYSFVLSLPFNGTTKLTLYYIDGENPALIDTGLGDNKSIDLISEELKKINKDIRDIKYIINTHEHIEHYGGNKIIKDLSGAGVICSENAKYKIENSRKINNKLKDHLHKYKSELAEKLSREIDFDLGVEESVVDVTIGDRGFIDAGDIRLQAVYTPGHSPGHMCLYHAEKKILFTGDHILATGSTFVGYDYREIASQNIVNIYNGNNNEPDNLSLYIDSLRLCGKLDLDIILPSHGDPVKNPYGKIEREIVKKERRADMFRKALEKHDEISLTELTTNVYGKKYDDFLHKGSALGYLARLNRNGEIKADMREDDLYLILKKN